MSELLTREIEILGMPIRQYKLSSCIADICEGDGWATIYHIASTERNKGHATELLNRLKDIYKDRDFAGTVPLNNAMARVYQKTGIKVFDDLNGEKR